MLDPFKATVAEFWEQEEEEEDEELRLLPADIARYSIVKG